MPQFPRLLLAVSPGNTLPQLPASVELAHMAYRIGPRCRLQYLNERSDRSWRFGVFFKTRFWVCAG